MSTDGDPLTLFAALRGAQDPREAMAAACRELREAAGESDPPIGLRSLLTRFDASIERRHTPVDALLHRRDEGWVIQAPPANERVWRRQRFTVAHELAHLILLRDLGDHPEELSRLGAPDALPRVERLCDTAAAELLLPPDAMAGAMAAHGLHEHGLVALYDLFRVSWTALLIRIGELLDGCAVTLWRRWARPDRTERQALRVVSVKGTAGGPWLPEGLTARYLSGSLVDDAYAGAHGRGELDVRLGGRSARWRAVAVGFRHLPPRHRLDERGQVRTLERPPPLAEADVVVTLLPPAGRASALAERVWEASSPDAAAPLPLDPPSGRSVHPTLW